MEIIKTNVVETKLINKQLFYMLEGTEEDGNEPVVQATEVARRLGYSDPRGVVNKIIKKHSILFKKHAFLIDLKTELSSLTGHAAKSKKRQPGQRKTQKTWALDEPGFYSFVAKCETQKAEEELEKMTVCFAKMRKYLLRMARKERKQAWIEFRQKAVEIRLYETDAIKEYVDYSFARGSKSAKKYYLLFTKMIYKALFDIDIIPSNFRERLTEKELDSISKLEMEISFILRKLMMRDVNYKEIFKEVKKNVFESASYYIKKGAITCQAI